ncbi:DUF3486 family protein [Acetobacter fallax]|uniref:DUF3486 family protein n=1 Tax=Acetobacter fallax TaxID=1737473 RepID=A0ABX0KFW7_9PROT|nr:DUF3486 family protein [Acetobacter fallax]NHO33315.1 DUF3486 family protein [Acetobacter fallax]NHO36936.1 DUF3486 family protein [Acetobacter fallax]
MANRPSSIDRLEPEIREEIGRLRGNGHTLDEILAALRELDVTEISRSALGRHVKSMEQVGQTLRHAQNITEAVTRQFGDAPASRTAQLNIELLNTAVLNLLFDATGSASEGEGITADTVVKLARTIDHLTKSSRADIENQKQTEDRIEKRIKKETDERLNEAMKERGLSPDTAEKIRKKVLGLK